METHELLKRRRSDFYTGCIILLLGIAMLLESTTFPMKESYAGVENVWYVSPALLPMLVSGLIIVLSLVLIRKAISDGGLRQAKTDFPKLAEAIQSENFLRFLVIVIYLIAYVYGLIPNGDFFLASMVFLFSFIVPFYFDENSLLSITFWPFTLCSIFIGISGYFHLLPTLVFDIVMIVLMAYMTFASLFKIKQNETPNDTFGKWRIAFLTSVLTPLILIPAFKFGLLVPLPTEGLVIRLMETIVH